MSVRAATPFRPSWPASERACSGRLHRERQSGWLAVDAMRAISSERRRRRALCTRAAVLVELCRRRQSGDEMGPTESSWASERWGRRRIVDVDIGCALCGPKFICATLCAALSGTSAAARRCASGPVPHSFGGESRAHTNGRQLNIDRQRRESTQRGEDAPSFLLVSRDSQQTTPKQSDDVEVR